jgi:chemotaxis protein methyltransferase CheR
MELTRPTFDELRKLIHRLCGLALSEEKAYLVQHRLEPVARAAGCPNFEGLARRLREPGGSALYDAIVEAITTAETSFFRDGHPFDAFRRYLLPRCGASVRVWSAATATGQEAYSLAMLVHDYLTGSGVELGSLPGPPILATDVSARVLGGARSGVYEDREVSRGLTPGQVARFFDREGSRWVVREEVRRLVRFRRVNLVEPLTGLGPFDAIFCRNVLMYFDEPTRKRICGKLHDLLADGGWLVLGAAENLYGIEERLVPGVFGPTVVYVKTSGGGVVRW